MLSKPSKVSASALWVLDQGAVAVWGLGSEQSASSLANSSGGSPHTPHAAVHTTWRAFDRQPAACTAADCRSHTHVLFPAPRLPCR